LLRTRPKTQKRGQNRQDEEQKRPGKRKHEGPSRKSEHEAPLGKAYLSEKRKVKGCLVSVKP
jgi:hypothetical protein